MTETIQYSREYPQLFQHNLRSIDSERHILVRYILYPGSGLTLQEAAVRTALISSLRTLKTQPYEIKSEQLKYAAKIVDLPETAGQNIDRSGYVTFAYPVELFSASETLSQVLTTLLAGVEYAPVDGFYLDRIVSWPKSMVLQYKGPRHGVQGIREAFGVKDRPLLGAIVKPRNGVPFSKIAEQCQKALRGGMDFLVDDLLMVDPLGELSFDNRVKRLAQLVRDLSKPGSQKSYVANVGASYRKAIKLARAAKDLGVTAIMVNGFTMGFPAMHDLVEELESAGITLPVITHNMGVGTLTRAGSSRWISQDNNGKAMFGVSEFAVAGISRIVGADAVHVGTTGADCFPREDWIPATHSLVLPLHGAYAGLSSFAVAEGDLTIANVWDNIRDLGVNTMLEFCTGLYAYPGGTERGARSLRKLVENVSSGMEESVAREKILNLAVKDKSLAQGLELFGYRMA